MIHGHVFDFVFVIVFVIVILLVTVGFDRAGTPVEAPPTTGGNCLAAVTRATPGTSASYYLKGGRG